jgi:hypothetical protein
VTALIILSTGAWNRGPETTFAEQATISLALDDDEWKLATLPLPEKHDEAKRINQVAEDATVAQMAKAFKKFSSGKLEKRKLLSRFINMVAA